MDSLLLQQSSCRKQRRRRGEPRGLPPRVRRLQRRHRTFPTDDVRLVTETDHSKRRRVSLTRQRDHDVRIDHSIPEDLIAAAQGQVDTGLESCPPVGVSGKKGEPRNRSSSLTRSALIICDILSSFRLEIVDASTQRFAEWWDIDPEYLVGFCHGLGGFSPVLQPGLLLLTLLHIHIRAAADGTHSPSTTIRSQTSNGFCHQRQW